MKTTLLAGFLTLTSITVIAHEKQQHTETELLAHLKTVKKDIETQIQGLTVRLREYPKGYGKENYFFLLDMITDIDCQLNHSLKNKIFSEQALENVFQLLCNDMETMDDVNNIINAHINSFSESNPVYNQENNEQETALIKSISTNHHQQYCQNNPDGDLIALELSDLNHPDTLLPFVI